MKTPRISLAGMLVAIAVVAAVLTALRSSTEFWLGVVTALSSVGLLLALMRAARGPKRAFWLGTAAAGGVSLACLGACGRPIVGPRVPGDGLLDRAHEALAPRPSCRVESYDHTGRVVSSVVIDTDEGRSRGLIGQLMGVGSSYVIWDQSALDARSQPPGSWISAMEIRHDQDIFRRIGHQLEAWTVALLGGLATTLASPFLRRRKSAAVDV